MQEIKMDNDYEDLLLPQLPAAFRPTKLDTPLLTLAPYLFKALSRGGDICEFGCVPELLSIPIALTVQALRIRTGAEVFAFDSFGSDSAGNQSENIYDDLKRWAAIIPVRPIPGAPAETCNLLFRSISLAWFDLPSMKEVETILQITANLLDSTSIIGINHLGDPARPEIAAWVERMIDRGKLIERSRHSENYTGFFSPA